MTGPRSEDEPAQTKESLAAAHQAGGSSGATRQAGGSSGATRQAGAGHGTPQVERSRPCVGPQVRRLRQERGLTLAQLAAQSGLNVGYLSQIENDKATPSLECLATLATAIEVPITWFLLDATPPPRVVRAPERRSWSGPGGVHVEEVDGGMPRDLRIVTVRSDPGQASGLHAHTGDEHHVVLSGRLRFSQGPHTVDLGPGDYLVWDATVPHDAACVGDEPAEVLIISHRSHDTETSRPER